MSSAAWTAIAQFAASGVYAVGNIVRPLTAPAFGAQYAFRCTTAGTASTEPSWSSASSNGNTVTTGGATFTNVSGQSAYGWTAAAGNLYAMTNAGAGSGRFSAGDRIYLSSDHSETTASNATYTLPNSQSFGVIQVISVNRAGSVPPAVADQTSGALIAVSTANSLLLDASCNYYWQGITLASVGYILFNSSQAKSHYLRNCALQLTGGATRIYNNNPARVTLDNTTVAFSNAGSYIGGVSGANSYPFELQWINTPTAVGGSAVPTILFGTSQGTNIITCRGVDLSALTTTLANVGGGGNTHKILLDSCRIASGLIRYGTPTGANETIDEVELVNCYDGTNIISERHTPAGDLTTSRTTTLVGGAQDDVGLFSHQMVSSTRADMLAMTLDSFWMDVENASTGASHTATVEIVSSASLNNTDISLQLEYLGTTGSSLANFASSLPSALTTVAVVPTSTAVWNNPPSTPVRQQLQVTFTPQQAGRLRGLVRLGKPSTTVYVNPQVTVT